jgi:hypothetical protein
MVECCTSMNSILHACQVDGLAGQDGHESQVTVHVEFPELSLHQFRVKGWLYTGMGASFRR